MRDRKRHDDHSDRALLTLNGKLAGRVAAPDFFGASQGVILHQDHLVGVEIIELDRAEDMPVQIFDADIDAVVGKTKFTSLLAGPEWSLRKPCFDLSLAIADVTTEKVPTRFQRLIAAEMEGDEIHEDLGDRALVRLVDLQ
jgi:hypothetical protein